MSTLLQPSSPPAAPSARAPLVLRSRHRWLRWRGVLSVAIVGLSATLLALWLAPRFIVPLPIERLLEIWAGGVGFTALLALLARALAPRSLLVTAQHLDEQFAAKNRLEAAVGLENSTTPLAMAHRQEIESYLEHKREARPVRILPWLAAAAIALLLAHILLVIVWIVPMLIHPATPQAAAAPSTPPPPASQDVPQAALAWQSPGADAKANPVEEVPIVATANSMSGLHDLTIEVSVNGTPRKSIPIPDDPIDKPGAHTINTPLHMEDLGVKPFDIVSYYMRGQRNASQKLPDVTSSIQFVQVRPFHDEAVTSAGPSSKDYDSLIRLKAAELRSVKENFILAHTDLPADNPVRKEANDRVGKSQAELAHKTDEVAQELKTDGYPAEMVNQLQQASPLMDDAGKKILSTQNASALEPQQKALNQIVAAEKFFHPTTGPVTGPASTDPNDPFGDKQKHDLANRQQAPSGQLEALVKNQTDLAQDLAKAPPDSDGAPANSAQTPPAQSAAPGATSPAPAPQATTAPPTPASPTNPASPLGATASSPASPANPATAPGGTPSPSSSPTNPATTSGATASSPASPANAATAPGGTPSPSSSSTNPATPPGGTPANAAQAPAPQAPDPFGPDAEKGTFAERETLIAQGISDLQTGNKVLPDTVKSALATAQKDATAALQALHANDNPGAQQPTVAATRDLQGALDAMNAAGDQDSKQALADAQQQLNALADQLRNLAQTSPPNASAKLMDLAKQVSQVRSDLESAADQEQQSGSAPDAQQLNNLAQAIQDQHIATDLGAMSQTGLDKGRASVIATMLEDLAGQAAHGMAPQQATTQDYVSLVNALEQTRANLAYLAEKAGQLPAGTLAPGSVSGTPGDQASATGTPSGQSAEANGSASAQPESAPAGQPGSSSGQGEGEQAGVTPANPLGQGSGQQPGQNPSTAQGQAAGQGTGTPSSPGANAAAPGQTPGGTAQNGQPGQGAQPGQPGQNPQTAQGSQPGQGSPSTGNPSPSTGSGSGSNPSGPSPGSGATQQANNTAGPASPGASPSQVNSNGQATPPAGQPPPSASTLEAYRDALDTLKSQAQQTADIAPKASVDALQKAIIRYDQDTSFRPVTSADVVRFYTDIQKPLETLILDLQQLQTHPQRTEIVKTPDLNDTPPAYRHAVSDYFESISRDYHPPASAPADDSKQ